MNNIRRHFLKSSITLVALLITVSARASDFYDVPVMQTPNDLNEQSFTLLCKPMTCTDVEKPSNSDSWCTADILAQEPFALKLTPKNTAYSSNSIVSLTVNAEGDQLSYVDFKGSDLNKLTDQLQYGHFSEKEITGTFNDGYYWMDSFYKRYQLKLNCEASL